MLLECQQFNGKKIETNLPNNISIFLKNKLQIMRYTLKYIKIINVYETVWKKY